MLIMIKKRKRKVNDYALMQPAAEPIRPASGKSKLLAAELVWKRNIVLIEDLDDRPPFSTQRRISSTIVD